MTSQRVTSGKKGRQKSVLDPRINKYKANIGVPFHCYACKETHTSIALDDVSHCAYRLLWPYKFKTLRGDPFVRIEKTDNNEYLIQLNPNGYDVNEIMLAYNAKHHTLGETPEMIINVVNLISTPNYKRAANKIMYKAEKDLVKWLDDLDKKAKEL